MRLPQGEHEALYYEAWLPMQEALSGSLDLFFRHAYASGGQFVRESDVYRVWKARLDPVPAAELAGRLRHLASEAENYRKLLVPEEEPDLRVSRGLSRLNRWGGQTTYPFLLNIYRLYAGGEVEAEEFTEVLSILESFLVRRFFARVHTGQLNRLFMRLYQQLPEGAGLTEGTKTVLSEPSRRWLRDEDFREALIHLPLYTEGRYEQRRLILESLEEDYESKEPVDLPTLTIEHVMPQTLTEEWVQTLGAGAEEHHQRMVLRLGNLTLTGYNSELSNDPFPVKREKLAQSNVQMNKEIAREKEWDFSQVEQRGRRLAERALRVWPGPAPSQTPETAPEATFPMTEGSEGQEEASPPVQNGDGWTDGDLRDALENSTRAMGRILPYLANRPGQRVEGWVLAELVYGKGASPVQLGGALGSFTRRIKSRYGRESWPFEAIHNKEKRLWEYRMDARTAEKIRSFKMSR